MAVNLALARKIHRAGHAGPDIGRELGLRASESCTLASIGRQLVEAEDAALTPTEIVLLRTLATMKRELMQAGETRSVRTKSLSARLRKAPGWCAAVCRKRLFDVRHDPIRQHQVRGYGFVHIAGNGFIRLTPAGWAVVAALETIPDSVSVVLS